MKMYCEERTIGCIAIGSSTFVRDIETIVDFGCGTGTSSRRLANLFPGLETLLADLSPYDWCRFLMESKGMPEGEWVEDVQADPRVALKYRM